MNFNNKHLSIGPKNHHKSKKAKQNKNNKVAQVKSLMIPEATKGSEGSDSLVRRWRKVMGAEDEPDATD